MHAPVLLTAPLTTPVTLDEARAHLRVDHHEEDALITIYINAATQHLDGWSGVLCRCLATQTWRQDYPEFTATLRLPLWPITTIASVTYIDVAGATQTASASLYELLCDAQGAYIALKPDAAWPQTGSAARAVSVTYIAGQSPAEIPAPIKHAILLMVGDWYEIRSEGVVGASAVRAPMAVAADRLTAPYRRIGL